MNITCNECGYVYDDHITMCPECGCPTLNNRGGQVTVTNCPSCGAPVGEGSLCAYCGCAYPRAMQQGPQQVIINNHQQVDELSSALFGLAGGVIGGFFGGNYD